VGTQSTQGEEILMPIRLTAVALCASAILLGQASLAGTASGQEAKAAPKPGLKALVPTQWWCEVSAQAASGVALTGEEQNHPFFISQIIMIPHPVRTTEDDVAHRCRSSFVVQFGARFDVITARAFYAVTADEASHDRLLDMNVGARRDHTKEFHMSEP
jgi:hypothetical protein